MGKKKKPEIATEEVVTPQEGEVIVSPLDAEQITLICPE